MQNNKKSMPPLIGASSLFVIFAVLCLTVFTLLTLSTANADRKLSDVAANAACDYYKADLEAEKIVSLLRRGEIPDGVEVNKSIYSFSCDISPTQTLFVELSCEDGLWTVLRWQAVSSNT